MNGGAADPSRRRLVHWRGPDPVRVEVGHLDLHQRSLDAHGTSVTASYVVDFRLTTGPGWTTRELDVRSRGAGWWRSLVLRRSDDGVWGAQRTTDEEGGTGGASTVPDLEEALDCDLGLCPVTNSMPILRHDLIGAAHRGERRSVDLVMAFVSVPDLTVHRSEQRYSVSDPVDEGGALVGFASERFRTTLEVDADGVVANYPGLARRVEV